MIREAPTSPLAGRGVVTLKDAAKIECEVARRLRSGRGESAAVGTAQNATKEDGR